MLSAVIQRRREPEIDMAHPFHTLPPRKTSAQIIDEAKRALKFDNPPLKTNGSVTRVGVKTVHTRRPFTPREKERTLFGNKMPEYLREMRPPSSFALSPMQFDTNDVTGRSAKISRTALNRPIGRFLPVLNESERGVTASADRRVHRHQFRTALSLCDLPEEGEDNDEGKLNTRKTLGQIPKSSTISNFHKNEGVQPMLVDDSGFVETSQRNVQKREGIERNWRHVNEGVGIAKADIKSETVVKTQSQDRQAPKHVSKVDQSVYYEEKIAPILDEINRAVSSKVTDEVLVEIIHKLYDSLELGGLLGRHFIYRTQVLKTIFKLVDREQGTLLANLARIMLVLKVSGSNLTSVCKLVFKVTRHDCNDSLFLEGNLLDLVLEAVACVSPIDQSEACVYGYGALKFLTMNSQLVGRLLHRGILELLVIHMKLISTQKEETGAVPEETGYALVQLTGTLRHVSSCERAFPLMLVTGAVEQICRLLQLFHDDVEVVANVVRVLSIISTQEECCSAAASYPGTIQACMKTLNIHAQRPSVVVRLTYALGNMLTNSDETRWELYNVENFTDIIFGLLAEYLQMDRDADSLLDHLTPSAVGSAEDVIIKIIRVLANISVHPKIGPELACNKVCLTMLVSVVGHKAVDESEELLLSALATLNNLSFYTRRQIPTNLHRELALGLCETLPLDHVEGLIETIRVFGNLTHSKEIRDILAQNEVLEVMIEMLDCDSRELVFVCAGVLVNMMSDPQRRTVFQQEKGVLRMIDVLQYFGYGDWQLCSLVCQVLWNYCASSSDIIESLELKEAERIILIMDEFLDDDTYFNNPEVLGTTDPTKREAIYNLWEDFAAVATKLLDRIEENVESTELQDDL